jgi:hypothetical protein
MRNLNVYSINFLNTTGTLGDFSAKVDKEDIF